MKKLSYSQHQRDYTLTGTSVIWDELASERFIKFFSYKPNPNFIMIEDGILYHFHAEVDAINRSNNWLANNDINSFRKAKTKHDINLKKYREFIGMKSIDPRKTLKEIYYYYRILLAIPLLVIELPEHQRDNMGKEMFDLCIQIRHDNEDIYKIGTEFERKIITDLEKQKSLSKDYLQYLTSNEIDKYFETEDLVDNIDQRKKFVLLKHTSGTIEIFYDKEYLKKFNLVQDINKDVEEIKGNIAFRGKVSGRVKILKKVEDLKDFKDGEIIVTSMTDPRYLSAMKKAKAFVTDEGGITCHASIIAREMKKPCIIATKIATRVLKDGDDVEVDANKGIVKKIS